jgi:hypothetical protein
MAMRTLAVAVTVLAVLSGAGWAFAASHDAGRVTSPSSDLAASAELVGASGTDATPLTMTPPAEPGAREPSASSETDRPAGAPDRVTTAGDVGAADPPDASPSVPSEQSRDDRTPPQRRYLATVHHPGLSADLRQAPDGQLIRLGSDMCRMVQQFGGDRAAAARGLTTAFRGDGQARLARDGGRLLNTAVRFLCPQYR